MFNPLLHIAQTTDIPITQFIPSHVNRSQRIFHAGIAYAQEGGYLDLTTSSDPRWLEEDEIKASKGLRMYLDAGVPIEQITFTSDAQGSLPIFDEKGQFKGLGIGQVSTLHREIRAAVITDGVELDQALRVVTTNPARILKLATKGRLEVGFDADLIFLDHNLEVETVIAKGRVMMRKKELLVKGTFEVAAM
jgi:beta-aspartyl-dipeptidase (metallo-type)